MDRHTVPGRREERLEVIEDARGRGQSHWPSGRLAVLALGLREDFGRGLASFSDKPPVVVEVARKSQVFHVCPIGWHVA